MATYMRDVAACGLCVVTVSITSPVETKKKKMSSDH